MNSTTEPLARRAYLDWLRVFAILAVFLYHSLHFFDPADWSVKNPTTYAGVGWFMDLIALWLMPLIFLISGASIFYAVRKTSVAAFARDKANRLLVPLLVGVFTGSIVQVYVERVSHGQFAGSFIRFLPHYFDGLYVPGGTGNFAFAGMHLWYLLALFGQTMVLLPLFWWCKGERGGRVVRRIGDVIAYPAGIILLAVPTIILQNLTDTGALGGTFAVGGWRPVHYLWFLLAGYLIVSNERLQRRIVQARWVCLAVFATLVLVAVVTHAGLTQHADVAVWPALLAILGFGMKHLSRRNVFLSRATEAVLPFYILHQTVLLLVGFFVVRWGLSAGATYAVIALSSFGACVLLYEYAVRRVAVLRYLNGMKPVERSTSWQTARRAPTLDGSRHEGADPHGT